MKTAYSGPASLCSPGRRIRADEETGTASVVGRLVVGRCIGNRRLYCPQPLLGKPQPFRNRVELVAQFDDDIVELLQGVFLECQSGLQIDQSLFHNIPLPVVNRPSQWCDASNLISIKNCARQISENPPRCSLPAPPVTN